MNKAFYGRCYEEIFSDSIVGSEVSLVDLEKAKHLNGTIGIITQTITERGRFPVKISPTRTIAVKPSNLLFHYISDNIYTRLQDKEASCFEWAQTRHTLTFDRDNNVDIYPQIAFNFFKHMLQNETTVKFNKGTIWNGWSSSLAAFTGKRNQANPGFPFECKAKYSIALIKTGIIEVWVDICAKYLDDEAAWENAKVLFRLLSQFVSNPEVVRYVLEMLEHELYGQLLDMAEKCSDGALQSLVLTVVGMVAEWSRKLRIREDLVAMFDKRAEDEGENMICWVMYEMMLLPVVKKGVEIGRPYGSHEGMKVYGLIDENMKKYDDLDNE